MDLNTEKMDGLAVVTLLGSHLDASNHELFMQEITPLIEENPNLLLDIGELQALDSSGLGAFAYCMRTARDAGGRLTICKPSPRVMVTFELVHIDRIIGVYSSREEAVESYKK